MYFLSTFTSLRSEFFKNHFIRASIFHPMGFEALFYSNSILVKTYTDLYGTGLIWTYNMPTETIIMLCFVFPVTSPSPNNPTLTVQPWVHSSHWCSLDHCLSLNTPLEPLRDYYLVSCDHIYWKIAV